MLLSPFKVGCVNNCSITPATPRSRFHDLFTGLSAGSSYLSRSLHHANKSWKRDLGRGINRQHGIIFIFFCIIFCGSATATRLNPWSALLDIGYGSYTGMYDRDGEFALERLGFGKILLHYHTSSLGFELSVQNGNTMRLEIPKNMEQELGGLPFQAHMQPIVDLLATSSIPIKTSDVFLLLKAGAAYRILKFDRCSANTLNQFDPEFQIGFGKVLNKKISLHLLYQAMIGKSLSYTLNQQHDALLISGMPLQQSVLFGITFLLNDSA